MLQVCVNTTNFYCRQCAKLVSFCIDCFQVDTLTVPDLKAYLQNAGIKVTGLKKAELVTKVYEHVGIDQPN